MSDQASRLVALGPFFFSPIRVTATAASSVVYLLWCSHSWASNWLAVDFLSTAAQGWAASPVDSRDEASGPSRQLLLLLRGKETRVYANCCARALCCVTAASDQSIQVDAGRPGGATLCAQFTQFTEFAKSLGPSSHVGHHVHRRGRRAVHQSIVAARRRSSSGGRQR